MPTPTELLDSNHAFWSERPITAMNELVDRTITDINNGNVVLLSGMFGIGKTRGFLEPLASHYKAPIMDGRHIANIDLVGSGVAIIDEASLLIEESDRPLDAIVSTIASGVIVFPDYVRSARKSSKDTMAAKLTKNGVSVVDAGDISKSSVNAELAKAHISFLGGDLELLGTIGQSEALRSPRLFDFILRTMTERLVDENTSPTYEQLIADIAFLIDPTKVTPDRSSQMLYRNMLRYDTFNYFPRHVPVISIGCIGVEQAVELYDLVDLPMPSPEHPDLVRFEETYGFNPLKVA